DAQSEAGNGCPPVLVTGGRWKRRLVRIRGNVSSQFLSGLLMAAPFAAQETLIEVEGPLVSEPYVEMTTKMMEAWRLTVEQPKPGQYRIPAAQRLGQYGWGRYDIEPDASAASYFWAAAAVVGGEVGVSGRVAGLSANSLQGDVRFVDCLERMGCVI